MRRYLVVSLVAVVWVGVDFTGCTPSRPSSVAIDVDAPPGLDAATVERSLAVPIENAVGSLAAGKMTTTSSSRHVRVTFEVNGGADAALPRVRELVAPLANKATPRLRIEPPGTHPWFVVLAPKDKTPEEARLIFAGVGEELEGRSVPGLHTEIEEPRAPSKRPTLLVWAPADVPAVEDQVEGALIHVHSTLGPEYPFAYRRIDPPQGVALVLAGPDRATLSSAAAGVRSAAARTEGIQNVDDADDATLDRWNRAPALWLCAAVTRDGDQDRAVAALRSSTTAVRLPPGVQLLVERGCTH